MIFAASTARDDSVVVKALCYTPEGCGFEIHQVKDFSIYVFLIIPAALGPEVYSASNRTEYEKMQSAAGV
jgi:hypothetical protein